MQQPSFPGIYIVMTMCLNLLTTVISVFVLYIFHHPVTSRPCRCVRIICKHLAQLLCINTTRKKSLVSKIAYAQSTLTPPTNATTENGTVPPITKIEGMDELLYHSRVLADRVTSDDDDGAVLAEWRLLAQIVDRICFCVVFIFITVSTTLVMMKDDQTHEHLDV